MERREAGRRTEWETEKGGSTGTGKELRKESGKELY